MTLFDCRNFPQKKLFIPPLKINFSHQNASFLTYTLYYGPLDSQLNLNSRELVLTPPPKKKLDLLIFSPPRSQQTGSPRIPPLPPMRVCCFGDSLTSGMTQSQDHPYSSFLAKTYPRHHFVNEGIGGDEATSYPARLTRTLSEASARHRGAYDALILWGGTNDVRIMSKTPEEIAEALQTCVEVAQNNGVKHIAVLTVPEMSFEAVGRGSIQDCRLELNSLIEKFQECATIDISTAIPMHSLDEEEKLKWWCDGLHLTKKGYAKVSDLICESCDWLKLKKK